MAKLAHLKISHFRGIESFEQKFVNGITCIIGRGDSGKSTILDAIAYLFSQSWSVHLNDSDFYKCNTNIPIVIEGVISSVPEDMLAKYGKHIRGLKNDCVLVDDMESADAVDAESVLTIRLSVGKDLEPSWNIVSYNGEEPSIIKANDRAKLNVFSVSDYTDRHFSLNKGNPLYSLYKQINEGAVLDDENKVLDVIREAKLEFDKSIGGKFDAVIKEITKMASTLGVTLQDMKAMLDHRDIAISENKVSIHEGGVPFRLKGKGTKRLLSLAIQLALTEPSGVILIDEIEQGLEPDRVQHLVNVLSKYKDRQIIITTHSRNVLVELPCDALYIMTENAQKLKHVEGEVQGCIRKNPEALFAKKILVCEGATEIGLCRALNNFRCTKEKESLACKGVCLADGTGRELEKYVMGFNNLGFKTALLCDSDDNKVNKLKQTFKDAGVEIVDCEDELAFEQQMFKDVSWQIVQEVVSLYNAICKTEKGLSDEDAKRMAFNQVKEKRANKESYNENWLATESDELRNALGLAAKSGDGWYKRISKAEALGNILFSHYDEIAAETHIKFEFGKLITWIES